MILFHHLFFQVALAACQPNAPKRLSDQLTELLTEVAETTAVFSEPGWLLRLEGHIEDLAQITQLHAALTSLAVTAGAAGPSNANVVESAGFNTASPASADQLGLEDQSSGCTAGPAGGRMQIQALAKPDWSDDSDALRGRLLEMGGVAGLQTDTDCLLLKDLCRPGLGDSAFLDLTDLELQVRQHIRSHVPDCLDHICCIIHLEKQETPRIAKSTLCSDHYGSLLRHQLGDHTFALVPQPPTLLLLLLLLLLCNVSTNSISFSRQKRYCRLPHHSTKYHTLKHQVYAWKLCCRSQLV